MKGDATSSHTLQAPTITSGNQRESELIQRLRKYQEELQAANEELRAANEEPRSQNERPPGENDSSEGKWSNPMKIS
jgi:hypothetical protein